MSKVALVVGAGGVLGDALCEEFRGAGYQVLGLRRSAPQGRDGVRFVACDLKNPDAIWRAANALLAEYGQIDVAMCNAAHLPVAPFCELALQDFDDAWRVCVGSAFACARAVLPAMAARRGGAMLMSGATASVRGGARFSAFAAAKFALRGLAQSLAREYQAAGVHVAHVVLDGLLRGSASAARFPARDAYFEPREVAGVYRMLAEQPSSAWTHELDLRPSGGAF
jgi:NAD(P)-dependent dehydrogenase (short-subunit alcohol dehydrogenase family)